MEKAIQELLDKQAITELMIRYAERIDANDPEGAAACFAEDGVGDYWGAYRGRKEIAARLATILDDYSATTHQLTNANIMVDGNKATAMSYVYAFHRMADGTGETLDYWGRWFDKLVKTDEGWLFSEKKVVGVDHIPPKSSKQKFSLPGHPGRLQR
ncbi:nuclear transport factor 2 family protein [Thermodesulfobacteriota bacterium]